MKLDSAKFTPPPPRYDAVSNVKKPKTRNKGIITANYAAPFAAVPTGIAAGGILKFMKQVSKLSPEETTLLRRGAREGLKQSGLYDKGVRAYRMQEVSLPKLKDAIKDFPKYKDALINRIAKFNGVIEKNLESGEFDTGKFIDSMFKVFSPVKYGRKDKKALNALQTEVNANVAKRMGKMKHMPEEIQQTIKSSLESLSGLMAKMQGMMFKTGSNACYLPNANKIITPDKTLQTSIFHEMGHALNNNGGIIMKTLQKARPVAMALPGIILLASILNKRKVNDEQLPTDSKFQRLKDGIKRNAGKLTALAMLPVVAEEGIASLRGGKIAKGLFKDGKLTKEILNKVRLTNLGGFATYALSLIGAVATVKLAIKVKDNIQAKHEAKVDAKYQAKLEKYNHKMAKKAEKAAAKA